MFESGDFVKLIDTGNEGLVTSTEKGEVQVSLGNGSTVCFLTQEFASNFLSVSDG